MSRVETAPAAAPERPQRRPRHGRHADRPEGEGPRRAGGASCASSAKKNSPRAPSTRSSAEGETGSAPDRVREPGARRRAGVHRHGVQRLARFRSAVPLSTRAASVESAIARRGQAAGGTKVTIRGQNLGLSARRRVRRSGAKSVAPASWSVPLALNRRIEAVSPAGAARESARHRDHLGELLHRQRRRALDGTVQLQIEERRNRRPRAPRAEPAPSAALSTQLV